MLRFPNSTIGILTNTYNIAEDTLIGRIIKTAVSVGPTKGILLCFQSLDPRYVPPSDDSKKLEQRDIIDPFFHQKTFSLPCAVDVETVHQNIMILSKRTIAVAIQNPKIASMIVVAAFLVSGVGATVCGGSATAEEAYKYGTLCIDSDARVILNENSTGIFLYTSQGSMYTPKYTPVKATIFGISPPYYSWEQTNQMRVVSGYDRCDRGGYTILSSTPDRCIIAIRDGIFRIFIAPLPEKAYEHNEMREGPCCGANAVCEWPQAGIVYPCEH